MRQAPHRLHHQGGAHAQDHGEGDFAHDQEAPERAAAFDGGAAALLQSAARVGARHFQRRQRAEQGRGQNAHRRGEAQEPDIHLGTRPACEHRGHHAVEKGDDPVCQDECKEAAGQCNYQAFHQALTHQLESAGSERGTDRHLALTARGPCEQQAGEVGAGNQKDRTYPNGQHPKPELQLVQELLAQADYDGAHVTIRIGVFLGQLGGDVGHVALRSRRR